MNEMLYLGFGNGSDSERRTSWPWQAGLAFPGLQWTWSLILCAYPDALCSPHVICCHGALCGHCVPLVLWLYMEHVVFLLLQCSLWLCWHRSLFLLLQPIKWGLSGLIKLPLAGKMQQVLKSQIIQPVIIPPTHWKLIVLSRQQDLYIFNQKL